MEGLGDKMLVDGCFAAQTEEHISQPDTSTLLPCVQPCQSSRLQAIG